MKINFKYEPKSSFNSIPLFVNKICAREKHVDKSVNERSMLRSVQPFRKRTSKTIYLIFIVELNAILFLFIQNERK